MAGQLGNKTVSMQNLEVVSIDEERDSLVKECARFCRRMGFNYRCQKKVLPLMHPTLWFKKIKKDETTKEEKINNNEAKENLQLKK